VILFWGVIGFLLFYLRQLLRETTRIRRLYEPAVASEVRA
jgi:hypothetical protein